MALMRDVELIEDPAVAAAALDPIRSRLLAELATPGQRRQPRRRASASRARRSTTTCARSRTAGWSSVTEERRHGGLTERVLEATAASYIVSPAARSASGRWPRAT